MLTIAEHNERVTLIQSMRAQGKTYREIGEALGITRQAAHRYMRFHNVPEVRERSITRNQETIYDELTRLRRKRTDRKIE